MVVWQPFEACWRYIIARVSEMHVAYHISSRLVVYLHQRNKHKSQMHVSNACPPLFFLHCVPLRTCLYDAESGLVCGQFVVSFSCESVSYILALDRCLDWCLDWVNLSPFDVNVVLAVESVFASICVCSLRLQTIISSHSLSYMRCVSIILQISLKCVQ